MERVLVIDDDAQAAHSFRPSLLWGAIANSKLVSSSIEIGIAPKESMQLFQPYTLEEGIGLGMSLAGDGVERVGRLSHQVAIISPDRVKTFTVVEQPNIFDEVVAGDN